MIFVVKIFLLFFAALAEPKHFHSIAGPFRIIIRRIQNCPDGIEAKVKMTFAFHEVAGRHGRDRAAPTFTGQVTMPMRLDDTLSGRAVLASWSNVAGWKENAHVVNTKHICQTFEMWLPNFWKVWRLNIFGELIPCPHLPGFLRFTNMTFTWADLPIKEFFYGRWRIYFEILNTKGDVVSCLQGVIDTLPK